MKIGYARVSTTDQNLERQIEALTEAGCTVIYQEKRSGKNNERPELNKMLKAVQAGDTVVVTKLDRLGRSLTDLISIVTGLHLIEAHFISLGESLDTTTAHGKFIFHIMGAMAEFERTIILDRVKGGIAHAKKHGTKSGKPFGRVATKGTPEKLEKLKSMVHAGKHVTMIAHTLEVKPREVYRYMRKLNISDIYKQKHKPYEGPKH